MQMHHVVHATVTAWKDRSCNTHWVRSCDCVLGSAPVGGGAYCGVLVQWGVCALQQSAARHHLLPFGACDSSCSRVLWLLKGEG